MLKLLTFLAILLFSQNSLAQLEATPYTEVPEEKSNTGFTVDDLVHDCKFCSDDPKSSECIYCDGVLTGSATVLGMLEINRSFCPPADMDTKMVRNFFRKWALSEGKKNSETGNMPAVKGVVSAMQTSFPCNPE